MYGNYFNLDEGAFSIAPNPKYLYLSQQHQEALAHLLYGVTRPGGFVLITGEIGTGKTTICRSLFLEMPAETDIALIINPKLNPNDLLASICDELKVTYSKIHPSSKTYINNLNEHLIKAHAEGRNTILIVDEAQNLSDDALEHIRVLTNLETDEQKLLQIILIGQPELRERLNLPGLEQLNQRITARFHLRALSPKEVKEYVRHRLKIGDGDAELFSNSNINCMYKLTGGIPRLINVLCDRTLLGAYVNRKKKISNDIIRKAAREALGARVKHRAVGINWAMVMALSIAGLLVAATVLIFLYEKNPDLFTVAKQGPVVEQIVQTPAKIPAKQSSSNVATIVEESSQAQLVISEPEDVTSAPVPASEVEEVKAFVELAPELMANESVVESEDMQAVVTPGFTPRQQAFHTLFELWQVNYDDDTLEPCEFARQHGLHCYTGNGDALQLQRLNRPAILIVTQSSQVQEYPVIKQVLRDEVVVAEATGEYRVTWDQIHASWQGDYVLLWKPLAQIENIRPNTRGEFVEQIDRNISIILNRPPSGIALDEYSTSLVNEVKTFQRMQNIVPDGVIGPLTQMYMNNLVRSDVPKLR